MYSVGVTPNSFLKQTLKSFESLNPTSYAISATETFFALIISHAFFNQILRMKSEGDMPVSTLIFRYKVDLDTFMSLKNMSNE